MRYFTHMFFKSRSVAMVTTVIILNFFNANLAFATSAKTEVTFAWDENTSSDIAGYRIYYSTNNLMTDAIMIDVGNVTQYTVTGLQTDVYYYFAATAYTIQGIESDYSNRCPLLLKSDENYSRNYLSAPAFISGEPYFQSYRAMYVSKTTPTKSLFGDVDGDGVDDLVEYENGNWHVLSSCTGEYSLWASYLGINSQTQLLADVDGDGRADAVMFFDNSSNPGEWHVALSNKEHFFAYVGCWASWLGSGSKTQLLGDVNGDKRADAVMFFDNSSNPGEWQVALSDISGAFAYVGEWAFQMGVGSKRQFLDDVDGDGKADIVMFFDTTSNPGKWYVAYSTPGQYKFTYQGQWATGIGIGSQNQFLSDVNRDGKADIAMFFNTPANPGEWYVAFSTPAQVCFAYQGLWAAWFGYGSTSQFLSDIDGDGRSDAIVYIK